ncbi:sugar transferase [Actinomyces sp. MRS3W]|uniref:sugar transferase n=1 Tax=Actinomyces sp. MRS3W TaxID=2800796 RepID=UPI0028FD4A49|nr:sugar transferase [Actinomyces sp. MRS3W]MDU0349611.1 sugar transferase [Actinomyces sp. MRS3W]
MIDSPVPLVSTTSSTEQRKTLLKRKSRTGTRSLPAVATSVVKRAVDVTASALLIVALTPVWLVVPLLVRRQDGGPVLFRQTRVGLDGQEFQMWKFRTMRVNADAELERLLREQNRLDKPLFKVDNDPRITRLGKILRRTSIDELPQLFNVLQGTMSLVGPRPQVPKEVALYDAVAARRLQAKPGITGLWQVSGRSSLPWEEAIRLDLHYVDNWTLLLDLKILCRTVKVVLKREGSQ